MKVLSCDLCGAVVLEDLTLLKDDLWVGNIKELCKKCLTKIDREFWIKVDEQNQELNNHIKDYIKKLNSLREVT
jgi:hypothetical protein